MISVIGEWHVLTQGRVGQPLDRPLEVITSRAAARLYKSSGEMSSAFRL